MAVMAMMVVVVPVVMMTPVVMMVPMVSVVMPAPMHLLHDSGGRLAACERLRQSRGRRSLGRGSHHRPGQDGCGR
jgi:hypothetical protein